MNITLNGKPCDTNAGNIISLLEEKNYRPELVAVEVNEDIIAKEGYRAYSLKEGDTVERERKKTPGFWGSMNFLPGLF